MKKSYTFTSLVIALSIILSCSSDETSTPVTPPLPIVKYTITLSAGEGGTVSTTGGEYESGQTVSVTATPQGEYLFKDWSDGNTDATRTITVNSNATLTANFEKKKYPLTVNIEGEGEVLEEIINAGRTTDYDSGTTVKLTAVPAEGFEFFGWTGALESTELEIQLLVSEAIEVTAEFYFKLPTYEKYSSINETTAHFHKQKSFLRYLDKDESIKLRWVINSNNEIEFVEPQTPEGEVYPRYMVHGSYQMFSDFDKDSKIDLFTSSWKFTGDGLFGNELTQHLFISDYFSKGLVNPKIIDSKFTNYASPMAIGDFDNDGYDDIWMAQNNRHNNADVFNEIQQGATNNAGQNIEPGKASIIYFEANGEMLEVSTGPYMDTHQSTFGDIDNDGDLDVILFAHGIAGEITPSPKILLNEGGRVFSTLDLLEDNDSFMPNNFNQWCALSWNLFDIDGDGNLDIFGGHEIASLPFIGNEYTENSELGFHNNNKAWIIWGTDKIQYSSNNIQLLEKETFNYDSYNHLGSSFTDFDNDGDIDLISLLTAVTDDIFYGNYEIVLHENKGNREFEDVTSEKVSGYYNDDRSKFGEFYSAMMIDKDSDGDYDIVPYHNADTFNAYVPYLTNLYWENIGGRFIRRENE